MKVVLQRVKKASVAVEGKLISEISQGLLALVCIEKGDELEVVKTASEKVLKLRCFEDESSKMNLSIQDIQGEILAVSQFTLSADLKKGTRPSFDRSEKPERAKELFDDFVKKISEKSISVKTGQFGAMMDIALINDGPVTFTLSF